MVKQLVGKNKQGEGVTVFVTKVAEKQKVAGGDS